jgi:hypothetical protein
VVGSRISREVWVSDLAALWVGKGVWELAFFETAVSGANSRRDCLSRRAGQGCQYPSRLHGTSGLGAVAHSPSARSSSLLRAARTGDVLGPFGPFSTHDPNGKLSGSLRNAGRVRTCACGQPGRPSASTSPRKTPAIAGVCKSFLEVAKNNEYGTANQITLRIPRLELCDDLSCVHFRDRNARDVGESGHEWNA